MSLAAARRPSCAAKLSRGGRRLCRMYELGAGFFRTALNDLAGVSQDGYCLSLIVRQL